MLPLGAQGWRDVEVRGRVLGGARPGEGFYALVRVRPDAFEFSPDNGWTRRGRVVRDARGAMRALAAPQPAHVQGGVLQGDFRMPVFLALYSNTDSAALVSHSPRATLESRMLGASAGPTYTLSTYYSEISNGNLNVSGDVLEWRRVSQADSFYEGGDGCQGLCGTARVGNLISELVLAWDDSLDYGAYDNDGADGIPNSGDDDGYVDAVVILHPEVGAECSALDPATTNNIWAHRFSVQGWGVSIVTNDSTPAGVAIRIRDYIIQGGQGGDNACTSNQPQAPGTVAHETGHLFGLPDLYATGVNGEGIGEWGLMGSGNYQSPVSPAYMEAWSRSELGWITEVTVSRDTAITLSPIVTADTAVVLQTGRAGEYFLLENRQALGSDAQINGPGLLIWHVDSVVIAQRAFGLVNNGTPYGLALEQADGLNQLRAGSNRGDAGDPYPGSLNRTRWGYDTSPSSARNSGLTTWVNIDSITQVAPDGPIRFRVRFGVPVTVTVVGNGTVTAPGLTVPGTTFVTDTVTLTAVPNAGQIFDGWSGDTSTTQATLVLPPIRGWSVVATYAAALAPTAAASADATMGADTEIALTATGGNGTYVWSLLSGQLPAGMTLNPAGFILGVPSATGSFPLTLRVTSGSQTAQVAVTLSVAAPALATATVVGVLLQSGASLSAAELRYLDLLGNRNGVFDLGDFLAWVQATGATPTSAEMNAVMARAGGGR